MTFATSKQATRFQKLVDAIGAEKALATLDAEAGGGLTVDQLAAQFFDWKARDVEARTLTDYRRDYANWIAPALGHRMADSVDERDVQDLVDAMAKRLEPKSVADRHMILQSMYKYGTAKSRRLVEQNPCTETQLPARKKKPPRGVTLGEFQALYDTARRIEPDAADLMMFIASTGWRWSEAAALIVRDVNEYPDREGILTMFATMGGVMRAGHRVDEAAKSAAGRRTISVPETAARLVRARLAGKALGDLVFTNPAGRKWYQNNFLERNWSRIVEASGLPRRPTPHMLRHTHVAMLDRANVSLSEMQRRLGHEDIATTIGVYGGMINDMSRKSLDALDQILAAATEPRAVEGTVVRGELG